MINVKDKTFEECQEFMPKELHQFIESNGVYFQLETATVPMLADCLLEGMNTMSTFYFHKGHIVTRLDYVESVDILVDNHFSEVADEKECEALRKMFSEKEQAILTLVEKNNFKWNYSQEIEDLHHWWDLSFDISDWNEEAYIECWKEISSFNSMLNEVCSNLGIKSY